MTFEWFKKVFSFQFLKDKQEEEQNTLPEKIEIIKTKDRKIEIIKNSHKKLKEIKYFCDLTEGLKCNKYFSDVLEVTSAIHDKCVSNNEVPINRLEEYHNFYTEQFIIAFDTILNDLKPKPVINEKLKSDYILAQEQEDIQSEDLKIEDIIIETDIEDNTIVSVYDLVDDIKKEKEKGFEVFSKRYATYINQMLNIENNYKKQYGDSVEYVIKFIGDSEKNKNVVFVETLDYMDGLNKLVKTCKIFSVNIYLDERKEIMDLSDKYKKDLLTF